MEIAESIKKFKTSIYLSDEDEQLLDELFIKRMRDKNKTDRSTLLCEGLRLLYAQEIGSSDNHK